MSMNVTMYTLLITIVCVAFLLGITLRLVGMVYSLDLNYDGSRERQLGQCSSTVEDAIAFAKVISRGDILHRITLGGTVTTHKQWYPFYQNLRRWDTSRTTVVQLRRDYDTLRAGMGTLWNRLDSCTFDSFSYRIRLIMVDHLKDIGLRSIHPERVLYYIFCHWSDFDNIGGAFIDSIEPFEKRIHYPHIYSYIEPNHDYFSRSKTMRISNVKMLLARLDYFSRRSTTLAGVRRKRERDIYRLLYQCCRIAPEWVMEIAARDDIDPHRDSENAFWLLLCSAMEQGGEYHVVLREWFSTYSPDYQVILHRCQYEEKGRLVSDFLQTLHYHRLKGA